MNTTGIPIMNAGGHQTIPGNKFQFGMVSVLRVTSPCACADNGNRVGARATVGGGLTRHAESTTRAPHPSRAPHGRDGAQPARLPPGLSAVPILAGSNAPAGQAHNWPEGMAAQGGVPGYDEATAAYLAGVLRPAAGEHPQTVPRPPAPPKAAEIPYGWAYANQVRASAERGRGRAAAAALTI